MHILDLVTILCVGLMIGTELAVSVFIHPTIRELDEATQAKALSLFARTLGRAMPFWYGASLALEIVEAYVRRHEATVPLLVIAIVIWIGIIVFTILVMVPINNKIAQLTPQDLPADWGRSHRKWDTLHRWRVVLLIVAMGLVTYALLAG